MTRARLSGAVIVAIAALLSPSAAFTQQFVQQGSTLRGSDAADRAEQGRGVAISADGNTVIIGGPDDAPPRTGAAWIFTRTGGVWSQQGPKLVGSGAAGASGQGFSVAISASGTTAVVGGPGDSSNVGAIWIFVRDGSGVWSQQGPKLVGTGAIGGSLHGTSVAMSADGNTVLVGGPGSSGSAGATWVFTRDGAGAWSQQGPQLTTGASGFGGAVALSGDGDTALIGNRVAQAAWVFTRSGSTWTQQGGAVTGTGGVGATEFGAAVALSADGATAAIGGPGDNGFFPIGAVWVFTRSGSTWTQQGAKLVGNDPNGGGAGGMRRHGSSVSLSSDGNFLLEGCTSCSYDGVSFAFVRTGGSWSQFGNKFRGPGSGDDGGQQQGSAVALSSDGGTAIVGAYRADPGMCCGEVAVGGGAAWIFTREDPPPPPPPQPPLGAGDIDGDGRIDAPLLKANGDWAFLKSSTNFTSSLTVNWTAPGAIPVRGDFDGDDRQDPALYDPSTGVWRILTSGSNFTTSLVVNWGGAGYVAVPGDYDGDGKADFAVYQRSTGLWLVLESGSNLTTSRGVTLGGPAFTPIPGEDFDGDAIADMAVYRQSTGVWSVRESSASFATGFDIQWGGPAVTLVPGDYDGDLKTDLATYDRITGAWRILKSSSGYTTSALVSWGGVSWGGTGYYVPVPGRFDADATWDLGIYDPSTGKWTILLAAANFTTSMVIPSWGSSSDMPSSTAITVGGADLRRPSDHDGDGRSDITVYNTASGTWSTRTSASEFNGATNRNWGGTGYEPAPGDYDGDGKTDLGLYEGATGWWYVLLSGANFTTSLAKNVGGPGWRMVPGDYDGDGLTDLAVYNTSTGQWYGLQSSTGYTTSFSVNYGGTGWTPVTADYDGDGKADIGVYDTGTGAWSILLSEANYTTSLGASCGGAGWTPVPADFDGDGKADIVVYNDSTGQWYGLKSSTTFTSVISVMWGGSGYLPVNGDYDYDGKADFATYVPSTGMWYILFSGGSSISRPWGGPGYVAVPQHP